MLQALDFDGFLQENYDGNATENWTPVYGMKTRCLNHWTMAS